MTKNPYKTDKSDTKRYRQAEEALRESEARYRSLFENSPNSLWEEDFSAVKTHIDYLKASGVKDFRVYYDEHPEEVSKCASLVKILNINKATIELLEARNKDEVFEGLPKIFTEESLDIFKEELIALSEGKGKFESEAPHLTLKGNVKKVIIKLTLVPEYSKTWSKLFISITDITEIKNIEENLRESEEKYRYLFENAPSSIILIDNKGIIRDVNPKIVELTGYEREELIGRNYLELSDLGEPIAQKYIPRLSKRLDKLVHGQELPPVELKIKTKDNKLLWFNFQTNVIKIGEETFLQSIGHDITEERKIQDNLIKTSNRANFYKDLFAHDMRNILTAISGSAELYSLYKDKSDKLKEIDNLFDMIREQSKRGAQLISNVQKLSKIEDSGFTMEKTDVNEILNDAIEFIISSYKNRVIKINISGKEAKYYTQANELLLDVFENLLINSIKHNDNPTVEIQIKVSKEKKKKKKYLKIEFIDNGRGIPDARKETIFQRVSNQERSRIGIGRGLSLVKFIIESYHGDILVKDRIRGNYSKGSNFIIYIPEASGNKK